MPALCRRLTSPASSNGERASPVFTARFAAIDSAEMLALRSAIPVLSAGPLQPQPTTPIAPVCIGNILARLRRPFPRQIRRFRPESPAPWKDGSLPRPANSQVQAAKSAYSPSRGRRPIVRPSRSRWRSPCSKTASRQIGAAGWPMSTRLPLSSTQVIGAGHFRDFRLAE